MNVRTHVYESKHTQHVQILRTQTYIYNLRGGTHTYFTHTYCRSAHTHTHTLHTHILYTHILQKHTHLKLMPRLVKTHTHILHKLSTPTCMHFNPR